LIEESAVVPKPVLGFYSLNVCHIDSSQLNKETAKRLPRVAPIIKLGRMAVAKQLQGQGVGKALMGTVLRKCITVFDTAGGVGLCVDAKDSASRAFYESFGFLRLPENEFQLFLPALTIRALVAQ
jgi:GNAT superfamily N-acetyltransferase